MNLVTADGGFDFSMDFNKQEVNISKLLLGTTASYVIEHAKIPVLVVPLSI